MPHIVLTGDVNIQNVFQSIHPIFQRDGNTILKTKDCFIDQAGRNIIVEAVSIDDGKSENFLLLISKRDDGLVVRLHPIIEGDKSNGMKATIAEMAKQIISFSSGLEIGTTNLQEFL